MWEQITTISEIDTVQPGTLLAQNNPVIEANIIIYKVSGKSDERITLREEGDANITGGSTIRYDELFTQGWWMLKAD